MSDRSQGLGRAGMRRAGASASGGAVDFVAVQAALAAASSAVDVNHQELTGAADPLSAQSLATRNYVDGHGFGDDTIVDLPNAAAVLKTALEIITSLPTATAGGEFSKLVIKLLGNGVQIGAFSLEPQVLGTDIGALASWNWLMKYNGAAVCSIGYNSGGQLFLQATGNGIILKTAGVAGAQGSDSTIAAWLFSTWGLRMIAASIQEKQWTNIASPAGGTLVIPAGTGAAGQGAGNSGLVTGSNQINLIDAANWQGGSRITPVFPAGLTLGHNHAPSGSGLPMLLKGGVDAVVPVNGRLTFVLLGGNSGTAATAWWDVTGVIAPV